MTVEQKRIAVIGNNKISTSYAFAMMNRQLNVEVCLIADKKVQSLKDMAYGAYFRPKMGLTSGGFAECRNATMIIFAHDPFLDAENTQQASSIVRRFVNRWMETGFQGICLVATPQSEVVAHWIMKFSGLASEKIIALGTMLDTAFLQSELGRYFQVNAKNVHAYMIGSTLKNGVPAWSRAFIGGRPILSYIMDDPDRYSFEKLEPIVKQMQELPNEPLGEGRLFDCSIALALVELTRIILEDEGMILTVGVHVQDKFGMTSGFISVPAVIAASGVKRIVPLTLSDSEQKQLAVAVKSIQNAVQAGLPNERGTKHGI
ncbi:lactate dehydrogenase [Listeria rocourtiae]|uniref:lactate dehydrogenase n=1 Tax=Listeria rocourtiae TaxID=647910 RepID=UPI0016248F66|nr:lactate dehydrogenase [Listeria rocourtiae]MBC1436255.1 lactate dehydrogenase [Listeria rocourtiae]